MIIKVPIYVEIENLKDQEFLPEITKELSNYFCYVLSRSRLTFQDFNLTTISISPTELRKLEFKIINKEKVLEKMRTKK